MLRNFESIRIGSIVDIGGEAPNGKHDIRFGDVVVSCPIKKKGGVVPYDFGKAVQDQEFERTGSLNSPPTVLLTALTKLSPTPTSNISKKINAQGGHFGNALQAASYRAHDQVMQMLLEKGADVIAQGGLYGCY